MTSFSKRHGYSNQNTVQYECVDEILRNRIWNKFFKEQFNPYDILDLHEGFTNIEEMMSRMGVIFEYPDNRMSKRKNAETLQKYILNGEWYLIYDFMEIHLELLDDNKAETVIKEYNKILEEEVSGYRILDGIVTSIISKSELQAVKEAKKSPYDAVNTHLEKALALFSDRKIPDYENSIKESISAVEALCKIIVRDDKATLGQALKKLGDEGIKIHKSFSNALSNLYGYSSDENGIRHGGVDFENAPSEDARFMLVTCSAFINYLIEKKEKVPCRGNNKQK